MKEISKLKLHNKNLEKQYESLNNSFIKINEVKKLLFLMFHLVVINNNFLIRRKLMKNKSFQIESQI